jgi:spoIIIJ-associated protein
MSQKQQTIEQSAPTIEEALAAGLAKLGVKEDRVDVEVLDEGRRGLLGIGGRDAVVRLTLRIEPASSSPAAPQKSLPAPEETSVSAPAKETAKPQPAKKKTAKSGQSRKRPAPEAGGADFDENEAETAREIIAELLEKMDVDADVTIDVSPPDDLTNRRMTVINVTGEDLGLLIGARGETLDALQHVARLMVGNELKQRTYFVIDVDGYRQKREEALARLAERMGQKAIDRGSPVTLEAMPSYERRIIHMTLRENPQVRTESTGEGDRRRVRIYPL